VRRLQVAVDIGGSKIAILAREASSGRDVYSDKIKTPATDGVEAILRLLDAQIDNLPGGRSSMSGLGVAVPGYVTDEGHVLRAGNLKGWVDVPLRSMLEDRYGVPIFVERDANCGAIGEKWRGAAREMNDFVFLALGTGVGAGLFLDGRIYRGAHFAAGEAGDISFTPEHDSGPTVSDVVGKRAIRSKVKRATGQKMSAAEALARAKRKPRLARATKDAVEYLGALAVAMVALLDPEAILFGGGTSNAGEALLERVRRRVAARLELRARLMPAGLGSDSQLFGALWGVENMTDLPKNKRSAEKSPGWQHNGTNR
jgi:glucokinase